MAKIKINYCGIASANGSFRHSIHEIEEVESQLALLQRDLPEEIREKFDISLQINNCCSIAAAIRRESNKLLNVAEYGLRLYQETEGDLCRVPISNEP